MTVGTWIVPCTSSGRRKKGDLKCRSVHLTLAPSSPRLKAKASSIGVPVIIAVVDAGVHLKPPPESSNIPVFG
jgi:hypothetical protein